MTFKKNFFKTGGGSGSGGSSGGGGAGTQEEYCAISSEHTMCLYEVKWKMKQGFI